MPQNPVELSKNPVELPQNPVELPQNPVELLENPVELLLSKFDLSSTIVRLYCLVVFVKFPEAFTKAELSIV